MKNFTVRELIIILNMMTIIVMVGALTALCFTSEIIFVYIFVGTAPVALLSILILDKYEKK